MNTRELLDLGFRQTILILHTRGLNAAKIAAALREEFGVPTTSNFVAPIIEATGLTTQEAMSLSMKREVGALMDEARAAYVEFRKQYVQARDNPLLLSKERNERMNFAADQFGKWWDRIARGYPLQTTSTDQAPTTNILAIIAQETRNGRIQATDFDRIIERVDGASRSQPIDTTATTAAPPSDSPTSGGSAAPQTPASQA